MQQQFQRTGGSGFNFGGGNVFSAMASRANAPGFLGGGNAGHNNMDQRDSDFLG